MSGDSARLSSVSLLNDCSNLDAGSRLVAQATDPADIVIGGRGEEPEDVGLAELHRFGQMRDYRLFPKFLRVRSRSSIARCALGPPFPENVITPFRQAGQRTRVPLRALRALIFHLWAHAGHWTGS